MVADLTPDERRFNDESNLVDSLYEFHPNFFDDLSDDEREAMEKYYLVGKDMPENIFAYRSSLLSQDPSLKEKGEQAFARLMDIAGVRREG